MGRRKRMVDTSVPEEDIDYGPSRSDKRTVKRALQVRLENIGYSLTKLSQPALEGLELGDTLEREIEVLGRVTTGSVVPRQRRRVAGLLRDYDLDVLERRIEIAAGRHESQPGTYYRLERLRDALLGDASDAALAALFDANPQLERQPLMRAIHAAKREKPGGDRRAYRALFRYLKEQGLGEVEG
ncbi:MAG: ribosome biogenesis factor YjgA [Sandaracinaceae bacterium]